MPLTAAADTSRFRTAWLNAVFVCGDISAEADASSRERSNQAACFRVGDLLHKEVAHASSRPSETRLHPLPIAEAKRLKNWLTFPERFSALDPCVGDGVAFTQLLRDLPAAHRYAIEIDAYRAEQARALGINSAREHYGCPVPAGSGVPALPESSVRLGIGREQQPETGIGLSGARVSLAEGRWCAAIRDPPAGIGKMREIAERTLRGFACVPAHRTGLLAIQADRRAGNTPQTALQGF